MNSFFSKYKQFFTDKNGKVVILQAPNIPIILWFLLTIYGYFLTDGTYKEIISWSAFASLLLWASMEIVAGTSPFRRVLGLTVLIVTLYSKLF